MQVVQKEQEEVIRLDLAPYTILVDPSGFLAGDVFEGALGFVARISTRNGSSRALKIPRLLADTDLENHYICSITEQEGQIAADLVNTSGLTWLDNAGTFPLRTVAQGAGQQQALLVQFSKELRPRFCLVSADLAQGHLVFTPYIESLAGWLTFDLWQEAMAKGLGGNNSELTGTVVVRRTSASRTDEGERPAAAPRGAVESFLLVERQAGRESTAAETWYLGLPSPVYFWREGTLEHAVRQGGRGRWTWNDHCALCIQLAEGLRSLYDMRFVHGDLRPANVMHDGHLTNPGNYTLVDYASFSGLASALSHPAPGEAAGQTLVGVAVGEARQSPFYPVERRVGRERENCDTVVIRRVGDNWLIHIGYRKEMFEQPVGQQDTAQIPVQKLSAAALEQIERVQRPPQEPPAPSEWKRGDKIRVRDFVFQLDSWETGPTGFSIASKQAWLVHNNRILVELEHEPFVGKDRILSVSRTFPIWQWSMATDFFSLGVTLLYSLFFTDPKDAKDSDTGNLDNDFEAMIAVMSSVPYAGVILPNVSAVARLLESIWTDEQFADRTAYSPLRVSRLPIAAKEVKWADGPGPVDLEKEKKKDIEKNSLLVGRTWAIAMSVVQTTPGAKRVLLAVERNLAVFICLIDLAMQLMHRKEDLPEALGRLPWMCADRTAEPDRDKAQELIDHINVMILGLAQRFQGATEFICPPDNVLTYTSRSETVLRVEVEEANRREALLRDEVEEAIRREALLRGEVGEAGKRNALLRDELASVKNRFAKADTMLSRPLLSYIPCVKKALAILRGEGVPPSEAAPPARDER